MAVGAQPAAGLSLKPALAPPPVTRRRPTALPAFGSPRAMPPAQSRPSAPSLCCATAGAGNSLYQVTYSLRKDALTHARGSPVVMFADLIRRLK